MNTFLLTIVIGLFTIFITVQILNKVLKRQQRELKSLYRSVGFLTSNKLNDNIETKKYLKLTNTF